MLEWGLISTGIVMLLSYTTIKQRRFRNYTLPRRRGYSLFYFMGGVTLFSLIAGFLMVFGIIPGNFGDDLWAINGALIMIQLGMLYMLISSLFKVKVNFFSSVMIFLPLGFILHLEFSNVFMRNFALGVLLPLFVVFMQTVFLVRSYMVIRHIGDIKDRRLISTILLVFTAVFVVYTLFSVLNFAFGYLAQPEEPPMDYIYSDFTSGFYNPLTFGSLIYHLFAISGMLYLLGATIYKIKTEHLTADAPIILRNIIVTGAVITAVKITEFILITYFKHPPEMLIGMLEVIQQTTALLAALYNFAFVFEVFTVFPNEKSLYFLIVFTGILSGITLMGVFDPTSVYWTGVIAAFFLTVLTAVIINYGIKSIKQQSKPILKASMRYYTAASIISFLSLIIAVTVAALVGELYASYILENIVRTGTLIYLTFLFIAYWQPWWFKNRYGRANSRADLIYRDAVVIKGSHRRGIFGKQA